MTIPKAQAKLTVPFPVNPHSCTQVDKLASLDTFMKDISTGLDAEVPEGPEGKDNLMKVFVGREHRETLFEKCSAKLGVFALSFTMIILRRW